MYFAHVGLFVRNPFEPPDRHLGSEFESYIVGELAPGILAHLDNRPETKGLLQLPAGRVVDLQGKIFLPDRMGSHGDLSSWLRKNDFRIQLAWGHGRRDAFEYLAAQGRAEFDLLPFELVFFSDPEMATTAWSENSARSDLSPLQRVFMIERMMEVFGWSQKEVASRLQLSQAQVSASLRLRRLQALPAAMEALANREISERQAAALLPLADMPIELLEKKGQRSTWLTAPSKVVEAALAGQSSDVLRNDVEKVADSLASKLEGFDPDYDFSAIAVEVFELDDPESSPLVQPACAGCPARFTYAKVDRCADRDCLNAKTRCWELVQLREASAVSGIPVKRDEMQLSRQSFYSYPYSEMLHPDPRDRFAGILADGCPHLFLKTDHFLEPGEALDLRRWRTVGVGCDRQDGCVCAQKLFQVLLRSDPDLQGEAVDLEAHRRAQEDQQRRFSLVGSFKASARDVIAQAMLEGDPAAFRLYRPDKTILEVFTELADFVARNAVDWEIRSDPVAVRAKIVRLLEGAGLDASVVPALPSWADPEAEASAAEPSEAEETGGVSVPVPAGVESFGAPGEPGEVLDFEPTPIQLRGDFTPPDQDGDFILVGDPGAGRDRAAWSLPDLQAELRQIRLWISSTMGQASGSEVRGQLEQVEWLLGCLSESGLSGGAEGESFRHDLNDLMEQLHAMGGA